MTTTYKLFLDVSDQSLTLARYFSKNINTINSMPVYLHIVKLCKDDLDKSMVNKLSSEGIDRLPALIIPGKRTPFIGSNKIKQLFDKNIKQFRNDKLLSGGRSYNHDLTSYTGNTGYGSNPDISDYYRREMNNNDQEDEDGFGESGRDLQSKYRDAMEHRKIPSKGGRSNRNIQNNDDDDEDEYPAHRRQPSTRRREIDYDDDLDNVAAGDIAASVRNARPNGGDPRDDQMEQAMLENQWGI